MNTTIRLSIPAMKCSGCVSAIENALGEDAAISSCKVVLASKSADVTSTLSSQVVIDRIKSAGFDAILQPDESGDYTV